MGLLRDRISFERGAEDMDRGHRVNALSVVKVLSGRCCKTSGTESWLLVLVLRCCLAEACTCTSSCKEVQKHYSGTSV